MASESPPEEAKPSLGALKQLCVISGLRSKRGSFFNGLPGWTVEEFEEDVVADSLVPVLPCGSNKIVMIQVRHLRLLPENISSSKIVCTKVNVGSDLTRANAVELLSPGEQPSMWSSPTFSLKSDQYVSSKATLAAIDYILSSAKTKENYEIWLADINLALALSRIACSPAAGSEKPAELDSHLKKSVTPIEGLIRKHKGEIFFRWSRPNIRDTEENAQNCLNAVKAGNYHIYPSPGAADQLDVQFATRDGVHGTFSFQDFGAQEAMLYFRNSVKMDHIERIRPRMMAIVDHTAYWQAILHYNKVLHTLKNLENAPHILREWEALEEGVQRQQKRMKKISQILDESQVMIPKDGRWKISDNEKQRLKLCRTCFQAGMMISMGDSIYVSKENRSKLRISLGKNVESDPEIKKMHTIFSTQISGKDEMKTIQRGFGDKVRACLHCGKTEGSEGKMKTCSKCKAAVYCSKKCQGLDWKKVHSTQCKPASK